MESIIGHEGARVLPLIEVQAAHELRVSEVAVEFIREGFSWVPPMSTGSGSAKVSDGTAWRGPSRIEVEVELSPKKQARWNTIIRRYIALQEAENVGVVYVFGGDGLRKSFRNVMGQYSVSGWWHLGLTDAPTVKERQESDAEIARAARMAVDSALVAATGSRQPGLWAPNGAENSDAEDLSSVPVVRESKADRLRRERLANRERRL